MSNLSNFIEQSPFSFLGIIFLGAVVFFITSMYFLLQQDKKEKQIQNALNEKKLVALKAREDFKGQFKNIHQVRKKFKYLKERGKIKNNE